MRVSVTFWTLRNALPTSMLIASVAQAQAVRTTDYPKDGIRLGQGWSEVNAARKEAICIRFKQEEDKGQTKWFELHEITDRSSLMSQIEVSGEAQVKAIVASAGVKTKFAQSVKLGIERQYFAARALVQNGAVFTGPVGDGPEPQRLLSVSALREQFSSDLPPGSFDATILDVKRGPQVQLLPEYAKLARKSVADFSRTCGERFVSAISSGAELASVLSFVAATQDERRQLSVAVDASGWGAEAKGSVNQAMQTYSDRKQLDIQFTQSGGNGDPIPTDRAGFLAKIAELPKLASDAPVPYSISLQSYTDLPNWPAGVTLDASQNPRLDLVRRYSRIRSLWEVANGIQGNPSAFILDHGLSAKELGDLVDALQAELKKLDAQVRACDAKGGNACAILPGLALSDYEYRIRMPVPSNSFWSDFQLNFHTAQLEFLRNLLADSKTKAAEALKKGDLGELGFWARRLPELERNIAQEQKTIDTYKGWWPDALHEAIVERWIRQPSIIRCRLDLNDSACLDNKQISDLAARVKVTPP